MYIISDSNLQNIDKFVWSHIYVLRLWKHQIMSCSCVKGHSAPLYSDIRSACVCSIKSHPLQFDNCPKLYLGFILIHCAARYIPSNSKVMCRICLCSLSVCKLLETSRCVSECSLWFHRLSACCGYIAGYVSVCVSVFGLASLSLSLLCWFSGE